MGDAHEHGHGFLQDIFRNNEEWIQAKVRKDKDYFRNLGKGQAPKLLYIGCADSRVTAEELMGLAPGEVFVHRNIANMVNNIDLSAMSVINYAVEHLKVQDIAVVGHYGCGGVLAAMKSADLGILNPWLRSIRDIYRLHKVELNKIADEKERYKRLIELNVTEQAINLCKTPEVQLAYRERGLKVHAWVFDIETGRLIDLKINFSEVLGGIMEIYRLQSRPGTPQ